ncbi:hypothetical protein JOM56_012385 [Amanita muscaria]
MDLERMHDELHRGHYLTSQVFLEDTAKKPRAPYRLTKTLTGRIKPQLCMPSRKLTSSRPSGWSIDIWLCRSASAEKNTEEQREANREGISDANCSAAKRERERERERYDDDERANGLELDIRITDPVKLERRLKRQRSEAGDDAPTDSHASEERTDKGRESKHSKRAPGALGGQQDVDELNPSPVPSPGPTASAATPSTPTPAYHIRESRDNQVLFLVLCFRQRQRHRVASSLSEGKRLLLLPVQLRGSKPAGLSHSCSIVSPSTPIFHHQRSPTPGHTTVAVYQQPIQDADPSNPSFTPSAAPPQEASSLAPPIFVDTHMQAPAVGYGSSRSGPVLQKR